MYYSYDKSVIFPCLSYYLGQEITGWFFFFFSLVGGRCGWQNTGFQSQVGLLASVKGTLQAHVGSLAAPLTRHSLFCFSSVALENLSGIVWRSTHPAAHLASFLGAYQRKTSTQTDVRRHGREWPTVLECTITKTWKQPRCLTV